MWSCLDVVAGLLWIQSINQSCNKINRLSNHTTQRYIYRGILTNVELILLAIPNNNSTIHREFIDDSNFVNVQTFYTCWSILQLVLACPLSIQSNGLAKIPVSRFSLQFTPCISFAPIPPNLFAWPMVALPMLGW